MSELRPFSLVQTADQWRRASFENTALSDGIVQLAWTTDASRFDDATVALPPEGLAFDAQCRLFFTERANGLVRRILWAAAEPVARQPSDVLDYRAAAATTAGEFTMPASSPGPGRAEPCALAADENGRLFVGDAASMSVAIVDLWSGRLLRTLPLPGQPVDLTWDGSAVIALVDGPAPALLSLTARTVPVPLPLPAGVTHPSRVAVSKTTGVAVLEAGGTAAARLFVAGRHPLAVEWASDIEFQTPETLVVARRPGEDFLRLRYTGGAEERTTPLKGKGYDGRGIVLTPDGRIAFLTPAGIRHAVAARLHFSRSGRVTTFRLDSGAYQTNWGRLFLDACIPAETSVRVHCVAADEPPEDEPRLPRVPPANGIAVAVPSPELSPPMPPLSLTPAAGAVTQLLHRRSTGAELPWLRRPAPDRFETYEAPVLSGPGRFLWVTVELSGNGAVSPFVRSLRVEQLGHAYLNLLPRIYTREDEAGGFLRRYLAMFDETAGELDTRSAARQALLDPRSAPVDLLPWLAGFAGLVTDERWPETVTRQLVEEAVWLFRFRGTVRGMRRFLEIYLGREVIVIEHYRTRGLGGALIGSSDGLSANSVLGAGFRVGAAVAGEDVFVAGAAAEAFDASAHRFTVLIPAVLDEEELAVVQQILDLHRPAHTVVAVCTIGAGMRVGRGLHVGLSSMIGPTGGFTPLRMGGSFLGRGGIVGRPDAGINLTGTQLGKDSRVG
ncbi:MAG: phage tail protein I [Bryobacterales bacterium]|nr:phage tail protein I [Bryobacterales bacterium]